MTAARAIAGAILATALAQVSALAWQPAPGSPPPAAAPPVATPPANPADVVEKTAGTTDLRLSLSDATNLALKQLSTLRQAQTDEASAAEDLLQARAALLPRARSSTTVTYNSPARRPGDGTIAEEQSFIGQNAVHEYEELLGVTGDLSFGLIDAIRRSRALLEAARAGTAIARRDFLRTVSEAYYGAALATSKRGAAEESLASAEEFERVTNLNFNAGEVPEVDVIRARLETAARRDDAVQARQAELSAGVSLGVLLGYPVTQTPLIEPLPQTIDALEIGAITSDGITRRPEFAQLEARVKAARAGIGVARSDILPRISYSLDEGFDSDSLQSPALRQHRGALATANLDIPIFDWGATRSRWRQAELQARGAETQQELTVRQLNAEFAIAKEEAVTAAERVDNDRRALADAEQNLTISVARYRNGEAPISEATDAQTGLASQKLALEQALFDYLVARQHLREAAGE